MTDLISSDWQELDANNTNPSPNGVQGGYSPSQVAPILRTIRGAMKRSYVQQNPVYTTTGTGNAYILTYEQAPQGYSKGIIYAFFTDRANTGAATLNINNLGTRNIVHRDGSALTANQIKAGGVLLVVFDGTNFVYVSPVSHDAKLTGIPTVDGSTVWHAGNDGAGSTLDADLLDGQQGAFYQDASNINAGTLSDARLPSTMSGKTFTSGITLNGTSGETLFTLNGPTHTGVTHSLSGTLRGKSVYNATNQTIGWELFNSSGAGVRAMTFRESDGLLNVQGTVSSTGNITAGGNLYAGGGTGLFQNNGDVNGSIWGGYLSTWLSTNKVQKTGDTMTGLLEIQYPNPTLKLHYGGVRSWYAQIVSSGSFRLVDEQAGAERLSIDTGGTMRGGGGWIFGTDGNIYMPWAGKYLSTAIYDTANERGAAWRNDAIANIMPTIAAQGAGAVGTWALLKTNNLANNPGDQRGGGELIWANTYGSTGPTVGYGYWRCMGFATPTSLSGCTTLWMRYA